MPQASTATQSRTQTRTQALLGHLLKKPLQAFVLHRRPHTSWAKIATELHTLTGVLVSGESLRLWYGNEQPAERAS